MATNVGTFTGTLSGSTEKAAATALETHIEALDNLRGVLRQAYDRALRCGDRLLGSQPSPVGEKSAGQTPQQPPLMRRVEELTSDLTNLAEIIHGQLARPERL